MAGNPNTGSADANTGTDTNTRSAMTASLSPAGHSDGQQQRSRNDKQQPFHANLRRL